MSSLMLTGVNNATWADYVRAVMGRESGRSLAARLGQSESAISRWKNGAVVPGAREAVAFARAYDRDPVEALIAADYLTAEDVGRPVEVHRTLQLMDYTDLELAEEMLHRVSTQPREHELLTSELDEEHPAMQVPGRTVDDK
jgi:transcriptional regulator with XRE-family HTH domain